MCVDSPVKQPLVAAALGEAAALSFTVCMFPTQSRARGGNRRKTAEGSKEILREAVVGKGSRRASEVLAIF